MKRIVQFLVLCLAMGMCYTQVELLARGVTYLPMTLIGGTAGALVGLLDRRPPKLKMWQLCALGTLVILDVEFISGCFFNLRLHMHLWDYSRTPFNLDGQVCAQFALWWFLMVPGALWMNGLIRWKLFGEPGAKPLWEYYKRLLTFR